MSQIEFGKNSQYGDVHFRDTVGRDHLAASVSYSQNNPAAIDPRSLSLFFVACEDIDRDRFDDYRLDVFVNRSREISIFERLLDLEDTKQLLLIQDGKGQGKSFLLRKFRQICRTRENQVPVSFVSCGGVRNIIHFLGKIVVNSRSSVFFNRYKETLACIRSGEFEHAFGKKDSVDMPSQVNVRTEGSTQVIVGNQGIGMVDEARLIKACAIAFFKILKVIARKNRLFY
ncbi:MAG: hypothetical protein HC828_10725 [Blastochloris sp.]|nr:hypothetical protein [Blastochloris sp.]